MTNSAAGTSPSTGRTQRRYSCSGSWLAQKHGITEPAFVDRSSDHDALLLTGNRALRGRRAERGYSHRYDLGEEWQTWTGLPFVFSRWMARRDMDRQDFLIVQDALFVGQEDWMNNLYKDTGPRNDLLMLSREVLEYVQGMRFFMGVPEEKAVALFQEKLSFAGLGCGYRHGPDGHGAQLHRQLFPTDSPVFASVQSAAVGAGIDLVAFLWVPLKRHHHVLRVLAFS